MNNLRYIKDLILKNKYKYFIGVLCLIVVDGLQLILPWLIGEFTDLLGAGRLDKAKVLQYALIIIAMALGIASFRFFWRYLILGVSKKMEASLRERFYAHLQKLGAFYYNTHKTGDLMAHATNDMGNITMATGMGVIISIDSALIPVVAVVMMIHSAGLKLTLASFAPLVLLFVFMLFFSKSMQQRITAMQEAFSAMTETARENFSGIRVVKSFVQELKEIKKFEKANRHNRQMNIKFVMLMNMMFPTIMTISSVAFAIGLWYGGILVIRGAITLGGFIAFNGFLGMLIWPISALGWVISIFQRGSVSLKRVNAIMDEVPEIQDINTVAIPEIKGAIEIKNLTFAYPGTEKPVLRNINISLSSGKTLAIVGRTGSGKSTLINLIARLYNVPDGSLFMDGIDINRIPVATVRDAIGCVPQDTFLFSSTIRENMDFFHGKSEDEIIQASKTAMIFDDIMEYPWKFETQVGERGVTLSGGQKQRVAIARAVLKSPAIMILDDCLSAVDTRTEEEILKGLKLLMKLRTSIIASHRISTIQDADEIIVLEDGEIVERGTHDSLLLLKGDYYNLYQKQLLAEQIEGDE